MSWFSPLQPSRFDPYKAAHLLSRAGFGGTWEEVTQLSKLGLDGAVGKLVDFSPAAESPPPEFAILPESDAAFYRRIKGLDEQSRARQGELRRQGEQQKITDLKFWWLSRMMNAGRPLEEKMTLFWHSHFASSFREKIETCYPMWRQNDMFRRHALAPFPEMLQQVIRDPAMLVWLDNAQSRKGHPNENFARESMELFTMGVGNYSEDDVKASARSLTGNTVDRETWTFRFNPDIHDDGQKTYLGKTGAWNGDDVVRIICAQDATGRFMARKFLEYFVYLNPEPDLVTAAAELYRSHGYNLQPFTRTLFKSELFYSRKASESVVKSPVMLTIGALKSMGVPVPAKEVLTDALRLMGQDLFFPPDVNGWPGGMSWINSNMLLVRYNFANFLLNGVSPDQFKVFNRKTAGSGLRRREFIQGQRESKPVDWSPRQQLKALGADRNMMNTADVVDYYVRQFLQRPIPRELNQKFVDFLETDASGGHRSFSLQDSNFDERVRGLVHLIMSSPDYQLC